MAKEHWQVDTARLAKSIQQAAARAETEEDLKMAVEHIIQSALKQMGLDIPARYEKTSTTYGGRRDSVYGFITLEYKTPKKAGALRSSTGAAKAGSQLEKYLTDDAQKYGGMREDYLEKAVGVALDGHSIMFVRFSKTATLLQLPVPEEQPAKELFPEVKVRRGFQRLGPYPVSAHSLANLLVLFRASDRRPLTARNLAEVFAPPHDIACRAVAELYTAVMRAQRQQAPSRIKTFYKEWDRIFGVVYGQELARAEAAAAHTAELYEMPGGVRLKQLLFAIHTYYALLMKLIAIELVALQRASTVESFVSDLGAADDDGLRSKLAQMESGAEFLERGIVNFLEADFFSWYLDAWSPGVTATARSMVDALGKFEAATPVLEPAWTRDLLQNLYEDVVPKELRHALGEYYTPDWLAGYLIDRTGYKGKPGARFLDPACGSGTFLVQAIHRAIEAAGKQGKFDPASRGRGMLEDIVGFDLNPLAVLAARTNYLVAFARFIPFVRPISLPVYLCDSVRAPTRYEDAGEIEFKDRLVFTTTRETYHFPLAMQDQTQIDKFTSMVDLALRGKQSLPVRAFRERLNREFDLPPPELSMLEGVYKRIKDINDVGEDGIWARYIKNAFAPVYVGEFDFVIGNPPWIRWGYLSDEYREKTLKMWHSYGLFSLKGHETRLGAGEKDFSMLFTYVCADKYLKDRGRLGFLITMEVFKSKGAGEGFRGFELKHERVPLKVLGMDDMVDLKPFRAANKTALFVMQKGRRTSFPVSVLEWRRRPGIGHIPPDWDLKQVRANTSRQRLDAVPIDETKAASSWQTAPQGTLKTLGRLKGHCPYSARLGARVEPYEVFWLNLKEVRPDGILVVENQQGRGKRHMRAVRDPVERDLVYPAVAGGNMSRFGIKSHFYILLSQDPATRKPYPEQWMLEHVPLTLAYLTQFRKALLSRGSTLVREFAESTEFYAMYGIGPYTVAPYRVTWKRMASRLEAAVLSTVRTPFGSKTLVSTDTTSLIAVDGRDEAHYICALLNSEVVDSYIRSFSSAGRGFGAPSVMANLAIPRFNRDDRLHLELAGLSLEAHKLVKAGKPTEEVQGRIDAAALRLWNIRS